MNPIRCCLGTSLLVCATLVAPAFAGNPGGNNELLQALREADEARATQLIGKRIDLNARDDTGATALMWAVQRASPDLTSRLLKAGANPNLRDGEGLGPLQISIELQATDIALQLIAGGADPKAVRDSGESVLMTAARTGQTKIMQRLIERGADVNSRENQFNQTALMWAAGHPDAVKLLIEHGADVHARTKAWKVTNTIYRPRDRARDATPGVYDGEYVSPKGGLTALFFAVQRDDLESVRALLDAGSNVEDEAADASTALLLALYKWNPGSGGRCDLHDYPIAFAPNLVIANLLLDRGAKATVTDFNGYTPLHGVTLGFVPPAKLNQFCRISTIRVDGTNDTTPASVDVQQGLALARRLLALNADPNVMTRYPVAGPIGRVHLDFERVGSTPMHIAAVTGNTELMKVLLERGGDPNLIRGDGHSPLSLAARANALPLVELLVAHGGDVRRTYDPADPIVDVYNQDGSQVAPPRRKQTLLHIAAAAGSPTVVPFLVAHGVSLTGKNDRGEAPLALAESQARIRYQRDRRDAKFQRSANTANVRDPETIVLQTDIADVIKRLMNANTQAVRTAEARK